MSDSMIEVAKATVTIVPNMQGAQSTLTSQLTRASATAGTSAGAAGGANMLSGITAKLGGLGPALLKIAPVAIVAAVGKGLYDLGEQFDEMTDTIIIGTGASGEALEELEGVAEGIATTVPTSFAEAGDIVQDLNTRLGLTGDTLEDVGTKVAQITELTGEEFDTEAFSGAMSAWGESADEMASDLDTLFAVSQSTGIGMNDLASLTESVAPTMQTLGYSFDETAAMAGLLDKAGLDASSTLSKMAKGMTTLAQDGEEPAEAMQRVTEEIQGYIDKGDKASALDLASEIFGTKGASQFVAAVESGALEVDDFTDSVTNADGLLDDTSEATMSFSEKMDLLKNKLAVLLEPAATTVFDGISAGMDKVVDGFDYLMTNVVPQVQAYFQPMLNGIKQGWDDLMARIKEGDIENKLRELKGTLTELWLTIKPIVDKVVEVSEDVLPILANIIGNVIVKNIGRLIGMIKLSIAFWKTVIEIVKKVIDIFKAIVEKIKEVIEWVKKLPERAKDAVETIKEKFEKVKDYIKEPFEDAIEAIKKIPDKIAKFFEGLGEKIGDAIGTIIPTIEWETVSIAGTDTPLKVPHVTWGAKGGILDSAQLIGAGEAGREALLPLDRNTGWMDELATHISGGNSFNVTLNVDGAKDPELYASQFTRELKRLVRTGAV